MTHDAARLSELLAKATSSGDGVTRARIDIVALVPAILAELTAANASVKGLNAHVEAMQEMCTRFLIPEPYVNRDGYGARCRSRASRYELFIGDIIYMLDGPEQREAQGPAARTPSPSGAREMRPIWATVHAVETVPIDHPFSDEKTDPYWRIEIDGYCVDFDYQEAANNFADAINARIESALRSQRPGEGE